MTKPPAGASLLFGALADSGRIKQRKNGSYRMVLEGVDEINWFTDRPNRAEGSWKPQRLLHNWDKYFASEEPNAQTGFKADEEQAMVTFEMLKPKMRSGKIIFNIKPLTDSGKDKITGVQDVEMSDISLFINDASISDYSTKWQDELTIGLAQSIGKDHADLAFRRLMKADLLLASLNGADLFRANLTDAILAGAQLNGANLSNANLTGADLVGADLTNAIWFETTCPDGTINSGQSPCTPTQLNLA